MEIEAIKTREIRDSIDTSILVHVHCHMNIGRKSHIVNNKKNMKGQNKKKSGVKVVSVNKSRINNKEEEAIWIKRVGNIFKYF